MPDFIKPSEGRVTSHYHPNRLNPYTKEWKKHAGIDYGKDGDPTIKAAAAGTVTRASVIGGYGNTITIKHTINGKSYETLYAHLSKINVRVGQKVTQGQKIGVRGSTGNSTGEHLHFEIHRPSYAPGQPNAIDPRFLVFDPDVAEVQRLLNTAGFKVSVDGIQGDDTLNAVAAFQLKHNLESDGIAGAVTMQKLKEVTKPKEAPKVSEQTLTKAQDAIRQRAVALKITDGKNPHTAANQFYVWAVMVDALEARDKEIATLKKDVATLMAQIAKDKK